MKKGGIVPALNYEFARLELEAVAFLERGQKLVRVKARGGVVALTSPYQALMCVCGVKKDAPWNDRMDALTQLLTYGD